MKNIIHLLAYATPDQINTTVSARDLRTPLHLACAIGNLAIAQLLIWVSALIKPRKVMAILNNSLLYFSE